MGDSRLSLVEGWMGEPTKGSVDCSTFFLRYGRDVASNRPAHLWGIPRVWSTLRISGSRWSMVVARLWIVYSVSRSRANSWTSLLTQGRHTGRHIESLKLSTSYIRRHTHVMDTQEHAIFIDAFEVVGPVASGTHPTGR